MKKAMLSAPFLVRDYAMHLLEQHVVGSNPHLLSQPVASYVAQQLFSANVFLGIFANIF